MTKVEQFRQFELELEGPTVGNPFRDVKLFCEFKNSHSIVKVRGFYDGDGRYLIRYMPKEVGEWSYKTESNVPELDGQQGTFICTEATGNNHGPVKVFDKTCFSYEDGTPYIPIGTNSYVWSLQPAEIKKESLKTLKEQSFNKMRMCVFPKYYDYNTTEPEIYPYEGTQNNICSTYDINSWQVDMDNTDFDFSRFNPAYFRMLEEDFKNLDNMGIEADLIIFHPYDHWGFARMGRKLDFEYLEYLIARFASFKNIWWSMANEYDLMILHGQKTYDDWDHLSKKVHDEDPSSHLLSIHNWFNPPMHKGTIANWYDQTKPWITHLSIQTDELFFVSQWIKDYEKPVIIDEFGYEGNIEFGWGNITGEQMNDRFWRVVCSGGGATHGETYIDKPRLTERPIWWSHAHKLYGISPARIAYLRKTLEEKQIGYLKPIRTGEITPNWDLYAGQYNNFEKLLVYMSDRQPEFELLDFLPDGAKYKATLIDTWNMTETELPNLINNKEFVQIPRKVYQAFYLERVK